MSREKKLLLGLCVFHINGFFKVFGCFLGSHILGNSILFHNLFHKSCEILGSVPTSDNASSDTESTDTDDSNNSSANNANNAPVKDVMENMHIRISRSRYKRQLRKKNKESVNVVFNYSSVVLTKSMQEVLNLGLNFAVLPKKLDITQVLSDFKRFEKT